MKKIAVTDLRIPKECERALIEHGYKIIKLPQAEYLAPEVASHPDMVIIPIGGKLFCHERYFASHEGRVAIEKIVSESGLDLRTTDDETGEKYPQDVLFNAAVLGDVIICSDHTSRAVMREAESLGLKAVKVKQGYTKCSCAVIGERAIITADTGIARAADEQGIDVLLVSAGGVELPGYDIGFIGGACGYDDGKLFFCGDISLHPDGERVTEFCASHGCEAVSLCRGMKLFDVGTIFFF